jgi:hypothetical protein
MGAPGPFSNAPSDVAEWLPLLGSIVQALCGTDEQRSAEPADASQGDGKTAAPSDDRNE